MRVVTYNVHKCRGLDRRVRPSRIASVLREMNADIIALQEVVSITDTPQREHDQARFIADELGFYYCIGENRRHNGGAYGNVLLSRFPFRRSHNYNITWRSREPRGCLRVDIEVERASIIVSQGGNVSEATRAKGSVGEGVSDAKVEDVAKVVGDSSRILLHVFNVHLGTAFVERRYQGRRLVSPDILRDAELKGARIVLGDFNEWTHGLASRLLSAELRSADVRQHLRRARTYPGAFPLLHLDHIYFESSLGLERLTLHKSLAALVASDHLPLVADFRLPFDA